MVPILLLGLFSGLFLPTLLYCIVQKSPI